MNILIFLNKFFTKGEAGQHNAFGMAPSASRYSALEVKHYVFRLKCPVLESLSLVRKSG